ncbi:MAG: hypothetical protein MR009_00665 [Sutterellaceae bacterium]|nr:hypothetical protein [Sutterellaceae bacterium]MDD7442905.1 hypothetical protein [Sutterellaceae bacterium]MDY2868153.1 hypothetical protein [Mesosutterella sp.]
MKKELLDYGASVIAAVFLVLVWRYFLHYLLAPNGPLRLIPPDWVSGPKGYVYAFIALVIATFISWLAWQKITAWLRKRFGKYAEWLLDEPARP